jgi:5-hydroxyisourate hydrolase
MGKLSTHVLDTTVGKPASNLEISLYKKIDAVFTLVKTVKTNSDGRCDSALLENENLSKGAYELVFNVADYFATKNIESKFLQDVVIRFYIDDETQNYHVPLLITPYSYSTYRGS